MHKKEIGTNKADAEKKEQEIREETEYEIRK